MSKKIEYLVSAYDGTYDWEDPNTYYNEYFDTYEKAVIAFNNIIENEKHWTEVEFNQLEKESGQTIWILIQSLETIMVDGIVLEMNKL